MINEQAWAYQVQEQSLAFHQIESSIFKASLGHRKSLICMEYRWGYHTWLPKQSVVPRLWAAHATMLVAARMKSIAGWSLSPGEQA
jgi:hypothetical protein